MNIVTRTRSHRFPNPNDGYVDTTYYNVDEYYLDVAYQKLKRFVPNNYGYLQKLRKLYIDQNLLLELPPAKQLPFLQDLSCANNKISVIPFYPNMQILNISSNNVTNLSKYALSNLKYLDASYNVGLNINFSLPKLTQLYINDNQINDIKLQYFPILRLFDCSTNSITNIGNSETLVELNFQHNNVSQIGDMPNLTRMFADNNDLKKINSYPRLLTLTISNNLLSSVPTLKRLTKLVANNNSICKIGHMNNLQIMDLSNNNLTKIHIPSHSEYVYLYQNSLVPFNINDNALASLREMHVDYKTYCQICDKYETFFVAIDVQISNDELKIQLGRLKQIFDIQILGYMTKQFHQIKFNDRDNDLINISKNIRKMISGSDNDDLQKNILRSLTKIYYKCLLIKIFFTKYY
jgi:Leucine-rich repeat (LRR) protein